MNFTEQYICLRNKTGRLEMAYGLNLMLRNGRRSIYIVACNQIAKQVYFYNHKRGSDELL